MSINTHIRYTLTCDKCGSLYFDGEQYADPNILTFYARINKWEIHEHDGELDCYCPDCAEMEGAE